MKDKNTCLRCKFYRLKEIDNGICRINKDVDKDYPTKRNDDNCPKWHDSGQQYYIRLGWIKAQSIEDTKVD